MSLLRILLPGICLAVAESIWSDVNEIELNDDVAGAQDLNGNFELESNNDIGDKTTNASTTIPHQTILGSGTGPGNKDAFKFTVNEAGKGIFDIDYDDVSFRPDRFGNVVGLPADGPDGGGPQIILPGETLNTLPVVDIVTGAVTRVGRFGDFNSKLVLFDTDGTTELGTATSGPFAWGESGSNPAEQTNGGAARSDAYLEYNFTVPGAYYLQVESANFEFVPIGGTYELNISIPGVRPELIMMDGFESPP